MKKKIFLIAFFAMMLSLSACGTKETDSESAPVNSAYSEKSDIETSLEISEDGATSEDVGVSEAPETSEDVGTSEAPETSEDVGVSEAPETSEEEEAAYYTVTFDTDGGSVVEAVVVLPGEKVEKPIDPQKSSSMGEYEFLGWWYEGKEWDFANNVVTKNVTLVAKWKLVDAYTPPFLPKD